MKNITSLFLLILVFFISCRSSRSVFNPAKKFSPNELKQDFSLLQKILQANHPSLYWYSSKNKIDSTFSRTYADLSDSLTEQEFRNKISKAISQLRCGHTAVRSSEHYVNYQRKTIQPQFPLSLKIWKDSAVVISNYFKNDSILKRGTKITGINSLSTPKIIDSLAGFISTDGYSDNFKYQLISFNFPAYFKNYIGLDSQYLIRYIDSTGIEKERSLNNYYPKPDSISKNEGLPFRHLTKRELRKLKLASDRSLVTDTAINTAILSVNTFSGGKLISFYKRSFREIRKNNVRNVIIDLRLNTGGSVMSSTRFCQYLVDKPFRVADTVAAINRSFPYKKHIHPWFIYWLNMKISARRQQDNRFHFRFFERHLFKPKTRNHFNGAIYLLTGGYTFSAATLVAGRLKGQKNVTIVGEETGGGYYGNTAMHISNIILPNTKIRVSLPLFRIVLDKNRAKTGRGVLPDIEVGPSSNFIKLSIDSKLEKAKELIVNKKQV